MRPLRGQRVMDGGTAGRAGARYARSRATHGYFIDRSAVAESTVPRSRNPPLRCRGIDRPTGAGFTKLKRRAFRGDEALAAAAPSARRYVGRNLLLVLEGRKPG